MNVNLADVIAGLGLPRPVAEYRFHPERKWRFDWCWPDVKPPLAVEIDGGLYVGGRHSTGAGRERDLEKLNAALCLGWRVLVVSPRMVKDGRLFSWLETLLKESPS